MSEPTILRGPREVLAALPYLLGYHPERSVVLVSLCGRGLGPVARLDLPDARNVRAAVDALVGPVLRAAPDRALVIGYEERRGESEVVSRALARALSAGGVRVEDQLVVRGDRWYAPRCRAGCCPARGHRLPRAEDVPAVADFVAAGRAPLPSRDAVAGLVAEDPRAGAGVAASTAALRRRGRPFGDVRAGELWARVVDPSDGAVRVAELTAAEVARLAGSLHDREWRDGLVSWMSMDALPADALDDDTVRALHEHLGPPRPGGRGAGRPRAVGHRLDRLDAEATGRPSAGEADDVAAQERLLHRLLALCRAVPDACPEEAAAVCTVAACVAWGQGDGAVAREAVDRALRLQPGYRLARLVHRLVDLGIRPDLGARAG
ncbi:MAG TPA: DUF4192 domain-containing protein [Dermatophilaceae bacterium]|nr:DUF4192 domain-containing protein [Dermatophilaceae bacterium]